MKKLIIILGVAAAVVSCGQTPEEKFIESANNYWTKKSKEINDPESEPFIIIKVDSIVDWTDQKELLIRKENLNFELESLKETLSRFENLEMFTEGEDELTTNAKKDVASVEKIQNDYAEKAKTASTKKRANLVYFTTKTNELKDKTFQSSLVIDDNYKVLEKDTKILYNMYDFQLKN